MNSLLVSKLINKIQTVPVVWLEFEVIKQMAVRWWRRYKLIKNYLNKFNMIYQNSSQKYKLFMEYRKNQQNLLSIKIVPCKIALTLKEMNFCLKNPNLPQRVGVQARYLSIYFRQTIGRWENRNVFLLHLHPTSRKQISQIQQRIFTLNQKINLKTF
ncbi:hypothetical protein FGO68_gene2658 [Halteria grandinella]|uniref:Uncharacterized protein n=1 Tax=Halteria grandinella TaxID=5974 RepID=A0A8J8SW55_HALGN|nr:hypothetical protein FGO68_gene2658 [Halteria grandinella]